MTTTTTGRITLDLLLEQAKQEAEATGYTTGYNDGLQEGLNRGRDGADDEIFALKAEHAKALKAEAESNLWRTAGYDLGGFVKLRDEEFYGPFGDTREPLIAVALDGYFLTLENEAGRQEGGYYPFRFQRVERPNGWRRAPEVGDRVEVVGTFFSINPSASTTYSYLLGRTGEIVGIDDNGGTTVRLDDTSNWGSTLRVPTDGGVKVIR